MSPNDMIAAAIEQMNIYELFKTYMMLSECLYRSIEREDDEENTITIGCEGPGVKLEVSITLEESEEA